MIPLKLVRNYGHFGLRGENGKPGLYELHGAKKVQITQSEQKCGLCGMDEERFRRNGRRTDYMEWTENLSDGMDGERIGWNGRRTDEMDGERIKRNGRRTD